MTSTLQQLIQSFANNPKKLFLVDGVGASLSAFFLLALVCNFETYFGMPSLTVMNLAVIAICFALYSFTCAFRIKRIIRLNLIIICIANLLYYLITTILAVKHHTQLTTLGKVYFIGEILIILALVWIEAKTIKEMKSHK